MPWVALGAASPTEHLASDCSVRLDLDADDSSGAPGPDYLAPLYCPGTPPLALADADAVLHSGYRIDSVRLRLAGPVPDGAAEYLLAAPAGSEVIVSGQNTGMLTLLNAGPAKAIHFRTALLTARYENTAAMPTPGPRTVEVIVYAGTHPGDTAYAYLEVAPLVSAGMDTAIVVCADGPPVDLLDALGGAPGGQWLGSGSGTFVPGTTAPGSYAYTVGHPGCPADTAAVTVSVAAPPALSLGPDAGLCPGATLTLAAPAGAVWSTGSTGASLAVNQPGTYWAELTDGAGCAAADTVLVSALTAAQTTETLSACAGQPIPWQGWTLTADTTVCVTLTAINGCDSVHCLTASFYLPTLTFDTAVCAGTVFSWYGQALSQPGVYLDTLSNNGCLTATTLTLEHLPPMGSTVQAALCPGAAYTLAGQSFTTPGNYAVTLSSAAGCDSIVTLELTVTALVVTDTSAGVCAGETFWWHGQPLTAPGQYVDTLSGAAGDCDTIVQLTLAVWPVPAPSIAGDTLACPGASAPLSVTGGLYATYAWSDGTSAPVRTAGPGAYTVTVTDGRGCTGTAMHTLSPAAAPASVWTATSPQCAGEATGYIELTALAGGTPPYRHRLLPGAWQADGYFGALVAGSYVLETEDAHGCSAVATLTLTDAPAWTLLLAPDTAAISGSQPYLMPLEMHPLGTYSFQWQPPDGLSCADCATPLALPTATTQYQVFVTDTAGCTQTAAIVVYRAEDAAAGLYVPNAFSPNGDGLYDVFTPYAAPGRFTQILVLEIYDRWGSLVYRGENLAPGTGGWDGRVRGRAAPPGVYVYRLVAEAVNGARVERNGDVTVIN